MPQLLETSIAALCKQAIINFDLDEPADFRRSEMYVTIPNHGQVPLDGAFIKGNDYGAAEYKYSLSRELEHQCMRWAGLVNYVWCGYRSPKTIKPAFEIRKLRLIRAGVGIVEVVDSAASIVSVAQYQEADTRIFAAAFHSADGEFDPPAGSAGVRRQTADVSKWRPATAFLRDIAPLSASWKFLQSQVKEMRRVTSACAVKAIEDGDWMGVEVDEKASPSEFCWTGVQR